MSLQFFILPSEFRDEPELRLTFVCFGGFCVSNINKSSKMKVAAKPGAAVSHQTEDRNMATAAPQLQTPLRCVGWERRRVSCDEPKQTRSKEASGESDGCGDPVAINSDSEAPMRRLCSKKLSECIMGNVFYCS